MKRKIFLFTLILLIYLTHLITSDAQSPADRLPDGAIARFSPGALVYTVAFSPDGQMLASGGDDNAVRLWNVADGSEREAFIEHNKSVTSVAFSPDGQRLASASLDGFVRLWYVSSERQRTSLRDNGEVESVAFSPNGKVLASGSGDQEGFVTLWDISQERRIVTLPGHGGLVESVAFSPDGQLLASASRDKTIKLWNVDTQYMRKPLTGHKNVVHAVAFSPDGETLASSSRDNTIKLWDVSSGNISATFKIQSNLYVYAESVAFSPDGKLLAAACVDYTVKLWDVVNRREAATLTGHHGGVTSVAFSPDGRLLASGSRDRTVLLWDLSHFGFEMPPIADVPKEPDSLEDTIPEDPSIADLPKESEPIVSESETLLHHQDTTTSDSLPEEPERAVPENVNLPHPQDTTPPNIVILSPTDRVVPQTVTQFTVQGSVTDDNDVSEVRINNIKATVLEDGTFTATVQLSDSKNEIRVTATDAHNNLGTHRFIIVREESDHIDIIPPEIVIHSPASFTTPITAEQLTVEGSVIDDGGIAEVRVNGIEAEVSEAGTFTAIVPLNLGKNDIRITSTDTHGHMGTDLFTVYRKEGDTEGPEIHIDSATDSTNRGFQSTITSPAKSILVSGIVTDPSGVAEVMVNDTEAQVTGDRFSGTIQLVHGNNLIRVTATDNLGNQSVKEKIIRPPGPTRKDYALLFAVDTYDHWSGLRFPYVDTLNISKDLQDIYGFEVELIHNPTKEDILRELHKYAQKEYAPEDQLLIFFAGHGDFNTVGKMGYLVSQDTKKPEDDEYRVSYFSHSYFRDFIDRMPCKHIFLVMDTCYSGTFDERLAMRGEAEDVSNSLSQADIERMRTYTTRWYLTSGANEQVPDNSLFARALLDALRSEGGSDNTLRIKEILTYFEELSDPKPCFGEFGRNAPGSDFLFIKKMEQ